jgi:short-subunit dehydrogenase
MSDALRHELAPFGVAVVLVEPGSIKTCFDATAVGFSQQILSNPASAYRPLYQKGEQFAALQRHRRNRGGLGGSGDRGVS